MSTGSSIGASLKAAGGHVAEAGKLAGTHVADGWKLLSQRVQTDGFRSTAKNIFADHKLATAVGGTLAIGGVGAVAVRNMGQSARVSQEQMQGRGEGRSL